PTLRPPPPPPPPFPYTTLFRSRAAHAAREAIQSGAMSNHLRSRRDVLMMLTALGAASARAGRPRIAYARTSYDPAAKLDVRVSEDRKSTRLNSSHEWISYAVFC